MKTFIDLGGKNYITRVSRWIEIQHAYNVTKRHSLWDYATDENGNKSYQPNFDDSNGTYLDYFSFGGKKYAIEQFLALGCIWCSTPPYSFIDTDGKTTFVTSFDADGNMYNPIYAEFDECGERVRLYEIEPIKQGFYHL